VYPWREVTSGLYSALMKATVFFLLVSACSAHAQNGGFFKTANMLSAGCRIAIRTWSEQNPNPIDLLAAQSCAGYLQGAVDAFEFDKVSGSQRSGASICIPDDVKSDQTIRVFMKYSDDHPEELHKGATVVVWEAMRQAFPCPK
jgi:Rap1a immunity proteins